MNSAKLLSVLGDPSLERRQFAVTHPVRHFIGEFLRPAALMAFALTILDAASVDLIPEAAQRLRFLVLFGLFVAVANVGITWRLRKQTS